jgi:hypothetical protein
LRQVEAKTRGREVTKDPFDQFWEWANKPPESVLTIPVEIHGPVMVLSEADRRDRDKVNEAVRIAETKKAAPPPKE